MGTTRRRVLLGGAGLVAAGALTGAGMITDVLPGGPPVRRALGLTGPDGTVPNVPAGPVITERVPSAARSRSVDLMIMRPYGVNATDELPVCLALHGRGGSARWFANLGLPQLLTAAHQAGTPAFALVAVDCGDAYYLARDHDDVPAMLDVELPVWLGDRHLPKPGAALGISMGSFGALNYTRRHRDLRAVAVASPALFVDWPDADSHRVFRDEREWQDAEPLRHTDELAGVPLGVWCGTEDPYLDATRQLIDRTHPRAGAVSRGAHTEGYWRRVLPDLLRLAGDSLQERR
jgi:hypothetical protein